MTPEQHAAWKFCEDLFQRALVAKQTSDTALDYYIKTFGTIGQGTTVALIVNKVHFRICVPPIGQGTTVALIDEPLQGLFTVTCGCPTHDGEIHYLIDNYAKNTQYIKPPEKLVEVK